MTFKIKRTPRSNDVVDARLSRLAADLKVQRPEVERLFDLIRHLKSRGCPRLQRRAS